MKLQILTHSPEFKPTKGHDDDAGFDLRARAYCEVQDGIVGNQIDLLRGMIKMLQPDARILIMTGVTLGLEPGWEAQIRPRSGMALKSGITVTNSPGTIDAGYRYEVGVILHNTGVQPFALKRGLKIAQMVIKEIPVVSLEVVDVLNDTARGTGGYGSTDETN